MPGRINDGDIQALRERVSIVDVVGDYTALKRAGGSRFKGLCPFHAEKTPSFTVDTAKGVFHCFGCDAGGDAIKFVMDIEALSFNEAVERLARNVGIQLRYEEMRPGQHKALGRRTRLVEALASATQFFEAQLAAEPGASAYLAGRGIGAEAIARFRLGWAPDSWDALCRHLAAAGFTPEEVADAGLATRGQRGLIDRFRGRVVFPILDPSGRDVIAFGGRVLPGLALQTWREGEPPKYINSAESPVYHKTQVLYALNWARREIVARDQALVVEGYFDAIALHLVGVGNAVATCGTALTEEHFRQLERFTSRVVLALDADEAGYAAADRARALAEAAGIREVGVLALPAGQDPADLAQEGGAEAVNAALDSVKTAVAFQLEQVLRHARTDTPEAQVAAYRETFPLLTRLEDRALRYRYIRDLVAPAVHLPADRIEQELDAALAGRRSQARRTPTAVAAAPSARLDPQLQLERNVLQVALQRPELLPPEWGDVAEADFTAEVSRMVFTVLRRTGGHSLDAVLEALPDDSMRSRVRALALDDLPTPPTPRKVAELLAAFRRASLDRSIAALEQQLRGLDTGTSTPQIASVVATLARLERERRALQEAALAPEPVA